MTRPLTLLFCLLVLVGCDRSKPQTARSWYDAKPLLASLRQEERAGAARSAGKDELNDLTLYNLDLKLAPSLDSYELSEEIYFTNHLGQPLSEVVLRVYANAVGSVPQVSLISGACAGEVKCEVTRQSPSVIRVKPSEPLAADDRLRISLKLSGKLSRIASSRTTLLAQGLESLGRMHGGKGGGDYGLLALGSGIASFANFYAVLGRYRDGAWQVGEASTLGDLGADGLSHVKLRLTAPEAVRVASTGHVVAERAVDGPIKQRETRIVAAMVRDFSLLASAQLETREKKVGGVTVRSHFLPRDAEAGTTVLDAAAASLASFEKRFGRYPYVDLDVVEAPLVGGAGGVEFSGLVTVASMLYRPVLAEGPLGMLTKLLGADNSGQLDDMTTGMLEFVTAHEVAHQYFPGLVGSDSRSHPYMDEAMAQFAALLYYEDRYGKARAKQEGDRQVLANYQMMRLLGEADRAVDQPVEAFDSEIAYAGIVYGKAPFFYRELRKTVGDEAFFAGLRRYVDKHRFRTAKPDALVAELARGDQQKPVRALAARWLRGAHGDEDLGPPDLKQLLAGWIGEDAVKQLGPEFELVSRLLLRFMKPSSK